MAETTALPVRLAVIDTCLLIHLAEDHAGAYNTIVRCRKFGWTPVITQTVITELDWFATNEPATKRGRSSYKALTCLLEWGIQPWFLKPVGNGIQEIVADAISGRGLIPERERNDRFIVVEAGLIGAIRLISYDKHLIEADASAIQKLLTEFDLHPVLIVSADSILGIKS